MNKKKYLIIPIVLIAIILANYVRLNISYQINKKNFESTIPVYGNKENYVPQGLAYSDKYNIVLQTSHNKKNTSMLYVIDFDTGELIKELKLKDSNGKDYHKHVGGITTDNKTVWITNEYTISTFNLEDILNATDEIQSNKDIESYNRGDFCYYKDNTLFVGDFYLKYYMNIKDDTPLLIAYDTKEEKLNPKYVLSIPNKIQGMTMLEDNTIVFSRSFSNFFQSDLSFYKNIVETETKDSYEIENNKVPYYHLTKKELLKKIKLSPMAENIFYKDNSIYILYENSSDAFKFTYPKIKKVMKYNI